MFAAHRSTLRKQPTSGKLVCFVLPWCSPVLHSPFGIRHSPFGIRHSAFDIRHSAFALPPHTPETTSNVELRSPKSEWRMIAALTAAEARGQLPGPTRVGFRRRHSIRAS